MGKLHKHKQREQITEGEKEEGQQQITEKGSRNLDRMLGLGDRHAYPISSTVQAHKTRQYRTRKV